MFLYKDHVFYWVWITAVCALTLLTAWGIVCEDKLAAWERRTWARFRRWRKERQIERIAATLAEAGLTVVPMERAERRDAGCLRLIEDFYKTK